MSITSPIASMWIQHVLQGLTVIAVALDICFIDQTDNIRLRLNKIEAWIENFEKWIKSLPVLKLMSWHLGYISDYIDTILWKKHPNYICFITGYLLTAYFSGRAIYEFNNEPSIFKLEFEAHVSIPSSLLLYPMPANILGGLFLVIGRLLLRWGRHKNVLFLYMAVVVLKAIASAIVVIIVIGNVVEAGVVFFQHNPFDPKMVPVLMPVLIGGIMSAILFMALALSNAFWLLDWIIYLLQFSLILWLTVYLAIFITKGLRLVLRKTDSMYFTGAVGAMACVYETILRFPLHPETWTPGVRSMVLLYLGIGH